MGRSTSWSTSPPFEDEPPYWDVPHHGPHGHHGPPGPRGPPPFGRQTPFGGPGPFLPVRKEDVNELRFFFILNLLTEFPEGITVYQLQEQYKMPRGNVNRLLEELQEKEYVSTQDTVKDGRAQKLFSLTEKGQERLIKLKKRWAQFFSNMTDHAPLEEFANPFTEPDVQDHFLDELAECQSKEDAIDLARGIRSEINRQRNHIEGRLKSIDDLKSQLDKLIEFMEQQSAFDVNEIKAYLKKTGE